MNDDVHDLAGPYSLDAIDDLERARFEEHLARCPACQRDVDDFRAVAARLGQASAETPPPSLKASVLAETRTVRQQHPAPVPPIRRGAVRAVLAAVAVAAVLVIGVLSFQLSDARQHRDELATINEVLAASDATTMALSGPEGSGRLVHSAGLHQAVLVADGLPSLPADRSYQLWYMLDGTPLAGPVYRPDGDRIVAVTDDMPAGTSAIGLTEEPAGGSLEPTSPMVLSGEV